MNRNKIIVLFAFLPVVLLAAACGAGSGATSSAPARAGAGVAQGVQAQAGSAPASQAQKPASDAVIPATVPEGPRVQRTARIALQVASGRFDATLNDVIAIVDQAGGYISGSDAQAPGQGQPLRSGQATFQVPADRFDSVLTQIRQKGTPQNISISGNDVSQQYVDLQARLRNAEAQRNAILALMTQAKSVSDTIQIENQLGQVTAQIEQLKGQIDYLDHSTTFATVSVTISEAPAGPADQWGVQSAWTQAEHNLVGVVAFLVLALGTLAPVLVGGVILFFAGRIAWRRLGARSGTRAPVAE